MCRIEAYRVGKTVEEEGELEETRPTVKPNKTFDILHKI